MCWNFKLLPEKLMTGIRLIEQSGYKISPMQDMVLKAISGKEVCVSKSEQEITITYDTEPHFYMALARSIQLSNGTHKIKPKVKDFGIMLDCSRNAVLKPKTVKQIICLLVLLGYNYLELYTEDTYEIPGEPYFGHMRGRYSAEELQQIISFASNFGLEIIPCIQTLAHLNQIRRWDAYSDYMDIDDILLTKDERTYELIRKCLKFCKEIFRTKRINIGTDEAFHLGRGKYTDKYGYQPKHEIYLEHLEKVFTLCKEEGFEPEFWGDAFYKQDGADGFESIAEKTKSIFDGTQTPIYWDYSSRDKKYHSQNIQVLREYTDKVIYAGGLWEWIGFAPYNYHSNQVTDAAFDAAIEHNIDNIFMTIWGDDGAESSMLTVIPSLFYAAHKIYPCDVSVNTLLYALTNYTEEEWMLADYLNVGMIDEENTANAAKYLFYNDYIIGLMDYHIPEHAGEIYQKLSRRFHDLRKRKSQFAYLFSCHAELSNVLAKKATFGKRLYCAYHQKDRSSMKELIGEIQEIKQAIICFHDTLRKRWFTENKGFGFEVLDMRIGGLVLRADTVTKMLEDYLNGKIQRIDELEEERISLWRGDLTESQIYAPYLNNWKLIYTTNCV